MSDQNDLNWDDFLGTVDKFEKDPENKDKLGGGDFEALPKGPYNVVVQEAEKQVSQNTGADMIKVRVQVTEGPYANRVLFSYIVFTKGNPNAMRMTLEKLAAFGVTRELIATQKPSVPEIASLLEGQQAVAVVGIQEKGEYKGRNEVKSFRPLEGATPPNVTAQSAKPGVPSIPTPQPEATAPAPTIPLPDVAVGAGDAGEDPFG